ncbi:MAG: hypothetical protein K2X27_00715 [Candidatus Obscuribacterales bacterium]|nr:hypothetical protein [Candidatus Obscuribacterales bacterium]
MRFRAKKGAKLVELPVIIWVVFIVFLFPLIDFCSLGIGAIFLFNACSQACLAASKARAYESSSTGYPSAQATALASAQAACAAWRGINLNSARTKIITTRISDQRQSSQLGKLSSPPDTTSNTYQIELTVNADIDPLIKLEFPLLGQIQGISAPLNLSVTQRNYFENSQGLSR